MKRAVIAALVGVGLTAAIAPVALHPTPLLLWNATASAPIGLYRVRSASPLHAGDWVAARAPAGLASMFAARRYLPLGVPLVKQVAALAPSLVCRLGRRISIDAVMVAWARRADRRGRPLPTWRGCRRLGAGQVFLINTAPDSLDGRYFGPTPINAVIGSLTPLWTTGRAP